MSSFLELSSPSMEERLYYDKDEAESGYYNNGALNNEPANDDVLEMNNKNNFTTTTAANNEALSFFVALCSYPAPAGTVLSIS